MLDIESGALVAQDGLAVNSGQLTFDGGSISGQVALTNSSLVIGPGSTGAADFLVMGNSTLSGDVAASQTILVQGGDANGNATLTTLGDVTNSGTISFQTLDWGGYSSQFVLGGTLTNTATGVLTGNAGDGSLRTIYGNVVNEGTISADAGVLFLLEGASTTSPTFTQAGGTIDTQAGGAVALADGYLDFTGGTVVGELDSYRSTVDVASSTTATGQINLRSGNTLLGNAAPGVTLDVQGTDKDGDAVLTVADGRRQRRHDCADFRPVVLQQRTRH